MKTPTPLEWMLFHDGELDEPRRSEVAAIVAQGGTGFEQTQGLETLGDLVRGSSLGSLGAGVDLADGVMARIAKEGRAPVEPQRADALDLHTAPKAGPAANDNGRLLLGLTGLAAAAAVGLFVWGSGGDSAPLASQTTAPVVTELVAPAPETTAQPAPSLAERVKDIDLEESYRPVEVASVDFGSRTGAVIYMDEPKGAATTVVWLSDE
jgi:hypothetical protein